MIRALLALLLLVWAAPAAAQRVTQAQDTLSPEQRALQQLRTLGAIAQPDTARTAPDSIRPQQVRIEGRDPRPAGAGRTAEVPGAIRRDSIMEALARVGGYLATEYAGEEARFRADSTELELRGKAQVAREGSQLVADSSIIYKEREALACGYGSPVLHSPEMTHPLASDTVCFDVERQVGFARGAATRVQEGATWNVSCDAYFAGDNFYCHDAIFTDCDLPPGHYHYHFAARELKVVRGNVLVGRNLTLNFRDVPVFWLPFMVQSLSRGRRSGILMPRFGINDIARPSSRYSRRVEDVGFYWAINDYLGTELAMDWFSNNWTAVRGSLDYNWNDRFLTGGLTYRRYWKEEGGREFTIASQNNWQPDERTRLSLTANYATSSGFIRRRTFDPRELNRTIDSYASVSRRFDWGNMSMGASRRQHLSDNTVNTMLPNLSVSISPITLFEALPGEESWYSNASWQGDGFFKIDRQSIGAANTNPSAQSRRQTDGRVSSNFTVGRLGLGQSISLTELVRDPRISPTDSSVTLPFFSEQRGQWNTRLSYDQRLIGTSSFTPSIGVAGQFVRSDSSGRAFVSAPTRLDASASLRLEIFGFWPGVGSIERLRHRLSPTITYNYSPAARADSLQRRLFGTTGVAEQNRISIGLTQTFEGKYRGRQGAAEPDSAALAAADTAAATDTIGGRPLRRRQQTATLNLLAINTEAIVYDFVRARELGDGLVNAELTNSIQSDLLRGLQLSITHDLFRPPPTGAPLSEREFAPHLSRVNASFSLNNNSWLFRVLRLGSRDSMPERATQPLQQGDPLQAGPAVDRTESEYGLIGTSRRTAEGPPRGPRGGWNASFSYLMFRPRDSSGGSGENQMLNGNFSFQPTENWTVRWSTGYTFTEKKFANHILTLTRTLHDWDANFDFVKAQNGNFSFQFRVHLRANPDIKVDYSQSDVRGLSTTR